MQMYHRPHCSGCGSGEVRLVKQPANLLRFSVAFVGASMLTNLLPLQWRCRSCGKVFTVTFIG